MSIEVELMNRLAADGTVSGLVGSRIRAEWVDQNSAYPAISVLRVSGGRNSGLDASNDYWNTARIQVDCWADTYSEARALADAVTSSLHGFKGAAGAFQVESLLLENLSDLGEQVGDRVHRRASLDFFVLYL